ALGDLELDLLVLLERAVAARRDGRVVGEDVGAAVVGGDEAEALFSVEPLHGSGCHGVLLLEVGVRSRFPRPWSSLCVVRSSKRRATERKTVRKTRACKHYN